MSNTTKTIVWTLVFAGVGFGAYKLFFENKKKAYANAIVKNGKYGGGVNGLLGFDEGYLKAWASAAKKGQDTFEYNGKTLNTQGGRTKQ